ncbi:Uncharacterised protein [Staphylococcus kloosii]|jgi:uncharacterized membrane protein YoaK (UPF0700 family)|uniref:Mid2-like cell wall stress sensor domain protein n=1 Tax=Staphylococcus kloosii TaxID=29384 RepID=A0ABQ0XKY7_9STAP|nr:hypothetical protein SKL01_12700 [Staphylococcus kloosii]SUM48745.1 Uncharacterised protein [Staphylococcus kloosii]
MTSLLSLLLILSFIFAVYNMYKYFITQYGRNPKNLYWVIGSLLLLIVVGIILLQII